MSFTNRIEKALSAAIERGQSGPSPSKLASALHYTVTPGGARVRPTILLSVASACGDDNPALADAAAAARSAPRGVHLQENRQLLKW